MVFSSKSLFYCCKDCSVIFSVFFLCFFQSGLNYFKFFNIVFYSLVLISTVILIVYGNDVEKMDINLKKNMDNGTEQDNNGSERNYNNSSLSNMTLEQWNIVEIGQSFYGVSIALGLCQFLWFFLCSSKLGPIAISIKRVLKNVLLVSVIYLLL